MANWLANGVDWVGTALGMPELGVSEWLGGGKATVNIGNRGGSGTSTNAYRTALTNKQNAISDGLRDVAKAAGPNTIPGGSTGGDTTNQQIWNPGTGGSSGGLSAADLQQQRFYQALLDSLGVRKETAAAGINEKYDQGLGKIGTQRDITFSNLDREGNKLGDQRKKALGQIQADTQNILQGANTTLGMYGAGNSSASDMAAFGAADLANKSNADATFGGSNPSIPAK